MGSGILQTGMYYYVNKNNGDKTELIQIPATGSQSDKTEIVESGLNMVKMFEEKIHRILDVKKHIRYEIHVPKGAVIREFHP
jgi:hypothetical protein